MKRNTLIVETFKDNQWVFYSYLTPDKEKSAGIGDYGVAASYWKWAHYVTTKFPEKFRITRFLEDLD